MESCVLGYGVAQLLLVEGASRAFSCYGHSVDSCQAQALSLESETISGATWCFLALSIPVLGRKRQ